MLELQKDVTGKNESSLEGGAEDEEKALHLCRVDRGSRRHARRTRVLMSLVCLLSLSVSLWLQLTTQAQRDELKEFQEEYAILGDIATLESVMQSCILHAHMTLYRAHDQDLLTNNYNLTLTLRHAEEYSIARQQALQAVPAFRRHQGSEFQACADAAQVMMSALDEVTVPTPNDAATLQSTTLLVPTLEEGAVRSAMLALEGALDLARDAVQLSADERYSDVVDATHTAVVVTFVTLAILTVGFALMYWSTWTQKKWHQRVVDAIKACQRVSALELSVSTTSSSQSSAYSDIVSKSEAAVQLAKVVRRIKVTFVTFTVFTVIMYAATLASLYVTEAAVENNRLFAFKSAWVRIPAQQQRNEVHRWIGLFSTAPFPALTWIQDALGSFPVAIKHMQQLTCGDQSTLGNIPTMLDRLSALGLPECRAIMEQYLVVDDCLLDVLPNDQFRTDSVAALSRTVDNFMLGTAVNLQIGGTLIAPLQRDDPTYAAVLANSNGDDPPLRCIACPAGQFLSWDDECSDPLLEVLFLDRNVDDAIQGGRSTMEFPLGAFETGFEGSLAELDRMYQNDVDQALLWSRIASWSMVVCAVFTVSSTTYLWWMLRTRRRHSGEVRLHREWTLRRVLRFTPTLELFREFATKMFAEENLDFWLACEECKQLRWPVFMCVNMWKRFIESGSDMEINIKMDRRKGIGDMVASHCQEADGDDAHLRRAQYKLLVAAQMDVFRLMEENLHSKFLHWDAFHAFERRRIHILREKLAIMEGVGESPEM